LGAAQEFPTTAAQPLGVLEAITMSRRTVQRDGPPQRSTTLLALLALAAGCESDSLTRQSSEPALAATGAATVLAAGDIAGCQSSYRDDSTAKVIAQYPEATVLAVGDMAYDDGTAANFACYNASWGAFKARTRPAIGNHEMHVIAGVQDTAGQGYYNYWGSQAGERYQGYYAFDLGGWRIYALNSEISHSPTSQQYAWLSADLSAHPGGCQMAYWHRPSFTSAVTHPGATDFRPVWDLLAQARAEVVLSGHNHNYEVFAPQRSDGTLDPTAPRQFVVGTGGSPSTYLFTTVPQPNSLVRATNVFGLLKLDLTPAGATWQFVSAPGTTFTDTGSLTCDVPGTTPPPSNTPPQAYFGSACSRSTCKFTDRSTDTDGNATIMKWSWAFGDGTSFTTTNYESRHPSHTYRAVGTYKPTLTVTDKATASGSILHIITLSALNLDPTAVFTTTCTGLACTFADASGDPDGTIATRKWDYGDGTSGAGASHT
jgi:alkaline phosphatase